jgi:hypothetical protein
MPLGRNRNGLMANIVQHVKVGSWCRPAYQPMALGSHSAICG